VAVLDDAYQLSVLDYEGQVTTIVAKDRAADELVNPTNDPAVLDDGLPLWVLDAEGQVLAVGTVDRAKGVLVNPTDNPAILEDGFPLRVQDGEGQVLAIGAERQREDSLVHAAYDVAVLNYPVRRWLGRLGERRSRSRVRVTYKVEGLEGQVLAIGAERQREGGDERVHAAHDSGIFDDRLAASVQGDEGQVLPIGARNYGAGKGGADPTQDCRHLSVFQGLQPWP
jgi:hypothetical protein